LKPGSLIPQTHEVRTYENTRKGFDSIKVIITGSNCSNNDPGALLSKELTTNTSIDKRQPSLVKKLDDWIHWISRNTPRSSIHQKIHLRWKRKSRPSVDPTSLQI